MMFSDSVHAYHQGGALSIFIDVRRNSTFSIRVMMALDYITSGHWSSSPRSGGRRIILEIIKSLLATIYWQCRHLKFTRIKGWGTLLDFVARKPRNV